MTACRNQSAQTFPWYRPCHLSRRKKMALQTILIWPANRSTMLEIWRNSSKISRKTESHSISDLLSCGNWKEDRRHFKAQLRNRSSDSGSATELRSGDQWKWRIRCMSDDPSCSVFFTLRKCAFCSKKSSKENHKKHNSAQGTEFDTKREKDNRRGTCAARKNGPIRYL